MASVQDHDDKLPAPVHLWMAGGMEPALALGAADLQGVIGQPGVAMDQSREPRGILEQQAPGPQRS